MLLREQDLDGARSVYESLMPKGFEHAQVLNGMKALRFWKDREESLGKFRDLSDRVRYFFDEWLVFLDFAKRNGTFEESELFAWKSYVFGSAKTWIKNESAEKDSLDPHLELRLGVCEKILGNYEVAREILLGAANQLGEDSELLAHLADCHALLGELPTAKVLFREAFYHDPQRVDLPYLESEMIVRLTDSVRSRFETRAEIAEWIPVYGVVHRVFSVRRELRAVEYGKLRQTIYSIERELAGAPDRARLLLPRLINRYFWQIDYLVGIGEDQAKIDEVLLKIRSISPEIHGLYTK